MAQTMTDRAIDEYRKAREADDSKLFEAFRKDREKLQEENQYLKQLEPKFVELKENVKLLRDELADISKPNKESFGGDTRFEEHERLLLENLRTTLGMLSLLRGGE